MSEITLLSATSVEQVDQAVHAAIGRVESQFAGRVRGYYLVGSYAVGEAIPTSDVDIVVLFKGSMSDGEQRQFADVREACRQSNSLPIDLTAEGEAKVMRVGGVWFQTASRLLYGEDIRPNIPRKPVARHTRDLMHAMYPLLARVRASPPALTFPLDYPDPGGEFYGYDRRTMRLADGTERASTKNAVLNVVGAASALTLLVASQYVGSGKKSDIPRQYRSWVGGEWAAFVEEIFEHGRNRWAYLVPEQAADRRRLRALCEWTLAFENHFLTRYRPFLLAELQQPDAAIRAFAARRLGQVIYDDATVVEALHAAGERGDDGPRQMIAEALRQYGG